jgi:pimeloyl-ACP methyl ester carboxylesterase
VVIHGVGSILPLIYFVTRLADRAPHRHIFILDLGHVSMRLPRPSRFPSPEGTCSQICAMIDRHALSSSGTSTKAVFFTHSLGSTIAVWMLKVAPERLAGLVLCDPISLLLHHPGVAYNFVYRKSLAAAEIFFEWIAREQGIALTLGRHFHWFQNIFPMITDVDCTYVRFFPASLPTAIFLSEKDCIVPSARIAEVLGEGRKENVDVYVMPRLDHGGFAFHNHWLEKSVNTLVKISYSI